MYGYSKKGHPLKLETKLNNEKYSLLMAMSNQSIIHYEIFKGNVNSIHFGKFLQELPKASKLLLDNVRFHHTASVASIAKKMSHSLYFTPPYSPEFNPIEYVFSSVKAHYRRLTCDNDSMVSNIVMAIEIAKLQTFDKVYDACLKDVLKIKELIALKGKPTISLHE